MKFTLKGKIVVAGIVALLIAVGLALFRRDGDMPLARIDGEVISLTDFKKARTDPSAYQPYTYSFEGRKELLTSLIKEKILLQWADKKHLDRNPETRKAVKEYENTLLIQRMLELLRQKEIAVTDAEMKKYYEQHAEEYTQAVEILASHILLATQADAEDVLKRLKAGEPFDRLATQKSMDPDTAVRGTAKAAATRGLIPEFEEAAFNLKDGEISPIVKTRFGFHIIKKLSQRTLPPRTLEEAMPDIRSRLEREKLDQWFEQQKKDLNVQTDEKILQSMAG